MKWWSWLLFTNLASGMAEHWYFSSKLSPAFPLHPIAAQEPLNSSSVPQSKSLIPWKTSRNFLSYVNRSKLSSEWVRRDLTFPISTVPAAFLSLHRIVKQSMTFLSEALHFYGLPPLKVLKNCFLRDPIFEILLLHCLCSDLHVYFGVLIFFLSINNLYC